MQKTGKKAPSYRTAERAMLKEMKPMLRHYRRTYRDTNGEERQRFWLDRDYTVVALVDDKKQEMRLGYAVCSENDQFEKSKARFIAISRASKSPYDTIPFATEVKEAFKKAQGKPNGKAAARARAELGKQFNELVENFANDHPHLFDAEEGIRYHREKQAKEKEKAKTKKVKPASKTPMQVVPKNKRKAAAR